MWNTGHSFRYAVAILAAAAALFLRGLLIPLLGSHNYYHTMWPAVVFSAWYCGLGPSIVTTLLGTLGIWYWFLPPPHSWLIQDRADAYGMAGFLIFSAAIIALGESNRRGFAARSKLAAIVESSDDAIISKNLDGVITSWNKGAERVFGYAAEEAVGQHITLIVPPDRRDEEANILERLRRGERIEHFETFRARKDGTTINVSLTISPVKDSTGRVVGASNVARDISERKRAEQTLQRSEARLAIEANALAKLNDLSSRLWRIRSMEEGLDEMLGGVIELLGADKGNVQLWNGKRGVLTIAAQHGFDREFLDFFREVSANDDSACGRALRLGQPVVIEDVETDAPFAPFRPVARAAQFRSVVSAPMIQADGTPLGMISTYFASVQRPTDQDLRRLDLYVRQCSDFVQRSKTEEVIKERELSARLLKLQDEERRHIARELHDGVGQLLAAMSMNASRIEREKSSLSTEAARCAVENFRLAEEVSTQIRTMSYLMHPPLLRKWGWVSL